MIDKKMKIGEAVSKHPEIAEILMKSGMHCIGCHVAQFESIEEGCKAHGMTDEKIDELMKEINKAIKKKK